MGGLGGRRGEFMEELGGEQRRGGCTEGRRWWLRCVMCWWVAVGRQENRGRQKWAASG